MPITCPQCGEENRDGVVMCGMCGINLHRVTPPAPTPQGRPLTVAPPPEARVMRQRREQSVYVEEYAGFWIRFVAAFIDGLIMRAVGTGLGFVLGMMLGVTSGPRGAGGEQAAITIALVTLMADWLYYAGLESSSLQGTLGKAALGLKVTDGYGERISYARATGRYFAKLLSTIILFIGFIMAGFTECKQGLHDLIAGTYVVRK